MIEASRILKEPEWFADAEGRGADRDRMFLHAAPHMAGRDGAHG
jgi:hypothetical protein